jgi:hypothetical protein
MDKRRFKKGEIVSATKTFNGEIITGEFRGYRLFNDEIPDTVVGIVHVPGDGVYDVDVTSIRHHESKDERIRQELIEFIQWSVDRHFMREDFHQAKRPSEWIDYLEKQKLTATINGEPIPTENQSVNIPLEEWSEEDEEKLRDVVRLVEDSGHVKSIREHYKKFLTSLPERFNLRPERWSEDDEEKLERIDDLLWMLDDYIGDDCSICEERTTRLREEIKNVLCPFLKSLRPWKPTEEQMKALRECGECKRCIKELYEDLQKRYGTC